MLQKLFVNTNESHSQSFHLTPKFFSLERWEKVIYFEEDHRVLFIRSEACMKPSTVPAFDKSQIEKVYNKASSLCPIKQLLDQSIREGSFSLANS